MRARFVLALLLVTAPARAVQMVWVPASDGKTMLATDLYLKDNAPRPVLVMRGGNARAGVASGIASLWPTSAPFHLVAQDIRGSGQSQGMESLFEEDGGDGRALLDYLDKQTWSNKRVSMMGWSNGAIVDYLA